MKETLGIIGGFGGYATLDFYRRILLEFAGDKESEYPHLIIDCDFTMPSRTRGLLYGDDYKIICQAIADSIKKLISGGADHIVLVCGTAHAYLPDVYNIIPEAKGYVVDIIDALGEYLLECNENDCAVIAAEGALKVSLYSKKLKNSGISIFEPESDRYESVRYFIESVKRNTVDEKVAEDFVTFVYSLKKDSIILGCTEFPTLVSYTKDIDYLCKKIEKIRFYDPMDCVIKKLKTIMK